MSSIYARDQKDTEVGVWGALVEVGHSQRRIRTWDFCEPIIHGGQGRINRVCL